MGWIYSRDILNLNQTVKTHVVMWFITHAEYYPIVYKSVYEYHNGNK